ncbi:magnesium transporter [Rhypophila decipiens]|uniref:Magnesium transporter n=1 Tax=Rhypophila decipiens TaxID=261697 RepID=A0AAN6YB67_9PEZI|nr:magnesium transporter [Rhypophila decipiens]
MTGISKALTAFGSLLLAHACYSAHEHSALQTLKAATLSLTSTASQTTATTLPADIAIETVIATLVVLLGLVLSTQPLRPIQWRVWAGKIERQGEEGFVDNNGEVIKEYIGNPFQIFENRPGFVDIRKQRMEFAEWVKSSAGAEQ